MIYFIFLNALRDIILLMTTFYKFDKELRSLNNRLEHDIVLDTEWFENNPIKFNQERCQLLVSGHKHEIVWAMIERNP